MKVFCVPFNAFLGYIWDSTSEGIPLPYPNKIVSTLQLFFNFDLV